MPNQAAHTAMQRHSSGNCSARCGCMAAQARIRDCVVVLRALALAQGKKGLCLSYPYSRPRT